MQRVKYQRNIVFGFALAVVLGVVATFAGAQQAPGAGPGGPGQGGPPQPQPLVVNQLKPNIYWFNGGGGNTGAIVGTNGVIVIDAKTTPASGAELVADIAKITTKPITTVILTHSDGDHVNGLASFPKGLTIIAQEGCKAEMVASLTAPRGAAPADYMPTRTVTTSENVTIEGVHLRLLHFAPAHTSGDLMIYLPDDKIMFTGDIVATQQPYPIIHPEKNGSSEGWITTMNGILAVDATVDTFVPGHGDVQKRADLQKRLADTSARRDQIKALVAQGKSVDEVKQALGEPLAPAGRGGGAGGPGGPGAAGGPGAGGPGAGPGGPGGGPGAGGPGGGGGGARGGGFASFTDVVYGELTKK